MKKAHYFIEEQWALLGTSSEMQSLAFMGGQTEFGQTVCKACPK